MNKCLSSLIDDIIHHRVLNIKALKYEGYLISNCSPKLGQKQSMQLRHEVLPSYNFFSWTSFLFEKRDLSVYW
jgi:hypothetical protein